jgi:hypothetical protein
MTTISFSTVAQSISDIDYSSKGIHGKDASEIPVNGLTECPYLAPSPRGFISDIQFSREAFGGNGNEPMNLVYTMNWQYFHAPIGTLLTFENYENLLDNLAYILKQIANNDSITGAVDMKISTISDIGGISDPAGNLFHGVEIGLQVLEFINL